MRLPPPESDWLLCLIVEFYRERMKWNSDSRFASYQRAWSKLDSKFMRLAAAAYLHISYDLPRVLADQQPSIAPWINLSRAQAFYLFFKLDPIFPTVFSRIAKDRKIVGYVAYFVRPISSRLLRSVSHWVPLLRRAAWTHGQELAARSDRRFVETKMLEAVTLALEDTSNLPWSAGLLTPPDGAFAPALGMPVISMSDIDRFWIGVASLATILTIVGSGATRFAKKGYETGRFIDELGRRTFDYVSAAVTDPEGFDNYRQRQLSGNTAAERGRA
ncbi:hypothetical protein HMPREF9695_04245 [Afipia broomeae ATCC 49717]|uniref:Uncharacterized protein n=1 Tax=Afipia broomeae ATCC 49717 TaxID=883078 RepID=K8P3U3_9BRAD|nr:hypothetical protein HMPREF9695_04245 [Afipia broomeae ATCC 49717]